MTSYGTLYRGRSFKPFTQDVLSCPPRVPCVGTDSSILQMKKLRPRGSQWQAGSGCKPIILASALPASREVGGEGQEQGLSERAVREPEPPHLPPIHTPSHPSLKTKLDTKLHRLLLPDPRSSWVSAYGVPFSVAEASGEKRDLGTEQDWNPKLTASKVHP